MTHFDRTTPTYNDPPRMTVIRAPMTTTAPLFSNLNSAGIFAALMTLGPLAMAAFAVGRY